MRRALDEPPSTDTRLDVLYELGVAELNTDAAAGSEHLRQAVEALDGAPARPEIVLAYVRSITLLGHHQAANDLLRTTSDRVRDVDPDLRWHLEGRLIIWSQFDPVSTPWPFNVRRPSMSVTWLKASERACCSRPGRW